MRYNEFMSVHELKNDIQKYADPEKGKFLQRVLKQAKENMQRAMFFLA